MNMVSIKESIIMAGVKSLFFAKLPREIRDEIYRFTFESDEASISIIPLSQWIERDRLARRCHRDYTIKPAPTCPLYNLMVNRQFYEEASAAWLRCHSIECHHGFKEIFTASPVLKAYLTHFTSTWQRLRNWQIPFGVLEQCANLRELRLHISDCVFDHVSNKMCYRDEYVDADYQSIWQLEKLLGTPGLERVVLLGMESRLAKTEGEREVWGRNVLAFEQFLNVKLRALRDAEKAKAQRAKSRKGVVVKEVELTLRPATTTTWTANIEEHCKPGEEVDARPTIPPTPEIPVKPSLEPTLSLDYTRGQTLADFCAAYPAVAGIIAAGLALTVINTIVLLVLLCKAVR